MLKSKQLEKDEKDIIVDRLLDNLSEAPKYCEILLKVHNGKLRDVLLTKKKHYEN